MIRVECKCGKVLKAKPEAAGKAVKCPGCGAQLQVPYDLDTPKISGAKKQEPS
jgi:hypothetical protein